MKQLTSAEIRQLFLDFWESKAHDIYPSASLVPQDDPTLLWINSGVAALKHYLDGSEKPKNPKIANAQKCIRTNDIENVGVTARHQTFFEMLGNWSIGDYFKEEMLPWAWEFLTDDKWLGLDKDRLYMTYHPDDEESLTIWRETTQLSEDHFVPMEDNFWDLGAGPCGPDTEIFFDRGEAFQDLADDDPEMYPGGENERYLEIWNVVFSQFNHMADGTYQPLEQKNIDTGMGLERITSVIQNTETNFETDLFVPIIKAIEPLTAGHHYGEDAASDTAFKVIADHVRAVTFAIGDGALPSNEGRGYILRRLIRRSVMYAKQLGIKEAFLAKLVPVVAEVMGSHYPNIGQQADFIETIIGQEEKRFQETIEEGQAILDDMVKTLKENNEKVLSGQDAFKLYDTYGYPLELTEELLEKEGLGIDEAGFNEEMQAQRERARAARKQMGGLAVQSTILSDLDVPSQFTGYQESESLGQINALVYQDQLVDHVPADSVAYLVADKTPFYGERGGQVGDTGAIYSPAGELLAHVTDVQHAPNDQNLHEIETVQALDLGQEVRLVVDKERRSLIRKNHTATHLLHQALKDVLGDQVNQAGSLLDDRYLRFDFTYFGHIEADQLQAIEDRVNQKIYDSIPVKTVITDADTAKAEGAMALFTDKYDKLDEVRMVKVSDWSIELCGGTHVRNTAEIGLFKIISESGVGSGVRRIEALTSKAAIQYFQGLESLLEDIRQESKAKERDGILNRIKQLEAQNKEMSQEIESLHAKANAQAAKNIFQDVEDIAGIRLIAQELPNRSMDDLRKISDEWKQRTDSDLLVLATSNKGKANLLVAVKADFIDKGLKAGEIIKQIAPKINGGGGGRPDMAQAGGKNPAGIPDALAEVKTLLTQL